MTVFVTGGTGYVGGRIVAELTGAGYDVVGLARSEEGAARLEAAGATPVRGDLSEPDGYRAAAAEADAVIHAGFDYRAPVAADRLAIETFLEATGEREAAFICTSGLWVLGDTGGETLGDDAPTDRPAEIVRWRVPHERLVLDAGTERRPTAVVRPGYVYGRGGGSTARMFATATKAGAAEYIGDGDNQWNNIHVDDLARLYLAILEARASGVFNAVDGQPERLRDIAEAASRAAGAEGRTDAVPIERAREKIGPVADAMCIDARLEAPAARALGWTPRHASFTAAAPIAFEEWRAARGG